MTPSSNKTRACLCASLVLGAALFFGANGWSGSLDPPPGPPAPTMQTLTIVEPRTDVRTLPESPSAMHVITQPGSYYLTADIFSFFDKHGIEIAADNVVLDLSGFRLDGSGGFSLSGIVFTAEHRNVVIAHGTLRGWGHHGIDAASCVGCQVRDVRVADTGAYGSYSSILVGTNALVKDCVVSGNIPWTGIQVGDGSRIEGCRAFDNARGYELSGENNSIIRSTARNNAGDGIYIQSAGLVRDCISEGNDYGIRAGEGVRVVRSVVQDNRTTAIQVDGFANMLRDSVIDNSPWAGIQLANSMTGTTIVGLQLRGNGTDLMLAGTAGNFVAGNTLSSYNIPLANACGPMLDFSGGGTVVSTNRWANVEY